MLISVYHNIPGIPSLKQNDCILKDLSPRLPSMLSFSSLCSNLLVFNESKPWPTFPLLIYHRPPESSQLRREVSRSTKYHKMDWPAEGIGPASVQREAGAGTLSRLNRIWECKPTDYSVKPTLQIINHGKFLIKEPRTIAIASNGQLATGSYSDVSDGCLCI